MLKKSRKSRIGSFFFEFFKSFLTPKKMLPQKSGFQFFSEKFPPTSPIRNFLYFVSIFCCY